MFCVSLAMLSSSGAWRKTDPGLTGSQSVGGSPRHRIVKLHPTQYSAVRLTPSGPGVSEGEELTWFGEWYGGVTMSEPFACGQVLKTVPVVTCPLKSR